MTVANRVREVRQRLESAALGAGRDPRDITLVAVSKRKSLDVVLEASRAGVAHFGENRVQEAHEKFAAGPPQGCSLHMVGHLQANKARRAVELFDWVHSLHSVELARRLGRLAADQGKRLSVLVQVDLAGEVSKHGAPERELDVVLEAAGLESSLDLRGLMLLPPFSPDPEEVRPWFARLRRLAEARGLPELSMGMSHDFEVAIQEGATLVRVGEAIFGPRDGGKA